MLDIRPNLKSRLPEGNVKCFFKAPLKRFVFMELMLGKGLLAAVMTSRKTFLGKAGIWGRGCQPSFANH